MEYIELDIEVAGRALERELVYIRTSLRREAYKSMICCECQQLSRKERLRANTGILLEEFNLQCRSGKGLLNHLFDKSIPYLSPVKVLII